MGVILAKQQTISLEKTAGKEVTQVNVGLGWDPIKKKKFLGLFGGNEAIDLDASCVLIDAQGKVVDKVWFGQLKSRCGAVVHSGDNMTGDGEGDDETMSINLQALPANVEYIAITVNSFRGQTFNDVDNAFCRIVDQQHQELGRYQLAEQGSHTGVFIASLSRQQGDWSFKAHGMAGQGKTIEAMLPQIIDALVQ